MMASNAALERCHDAIEVYLDCMGALNEAFRELYSSTEKRGQNLASETVRVLLKFQFDRSLGAYCLIINRLVWDAEIVLRSVYETAVKIIYLGAAIDEKRVVLAGEYWAALLSISDKKGADRAELAARLERKFGSDDVRIFEALRNPINFDISGLGNKRFRDQLESRWSFSGIVKTLSSDGETHQRIIGLDALAHMYGMMSHLAHAGPKGLELMQDRATRGADLLMLEATHIYRMLNDSVPLGCFSLRFAHEAEKGRKADTVFLNAIFDKMSAAGIEIRDEFKSSQDEFYDGLGSQN